MMPTSMRSQAWNVLWLAWLSFASHTQASSACDASLLECAAGDGGLSDFTDFEDPAEGEPFEHDVLLLQVDLQLQSTRTDAKESQRLARPAKKAEESALMQLSGQSQHQAAALKLSLALRSIALLGTPGMGWLALEVTFGILAACLIFKLCVASFAGDSAGGKGADEKLSKTGYEEIKNKALGACYLVVFLDVFVYGAFAPMVPLLREKFSLTATEIASFLSIFSLSQALATPVLGFLSDKAGRRTVILLAILGETFTYVLCSIAEHYYTLIVCYALSGVFAATIGVAQAMVADVATEEERPVFLSYLQGAAALGMVLGPAVGGFMSVLGFSNVLRACALLCFCNLIFVWHCLLDTRGLKLDSSSGEEVPGEAKPPLVPKLAWGMFASAFLMEISAANWESCGAVFVNQTFFPYDALGSTQFIARMMIASACFVVLVTVIIFPVVSAHAGQLGSVLIGMAISVFAKVMAPLQSSKLLFGVLCQMSVIGDNLAGPNGAALLTELADKKSFGTCLGLMATFAAMARIVTPVVFAYFYDHVSHITPFLLVPICTATAGCIWVLVYLHKQQIDLMQPMEANSPESGEVNANSEPDGAKLSASEAAVY